MRRPFSRGSILPITPKIERGENGRRKMNVAWTYDERIEDGLYSYFSLEGVRKRIERPEQLELTADQLE